MPAPANASPRRPRTVTRASPSHCGLSRPVLVEVGLGLGAELVGHAALDPALAVEVLEVLELPVLRPRRADAQHLAPLPLPVDRAVGVVPVEAHRRAACRAPRPSCCSRTTAPSRSAAALSGSAPASAIPASTATPTPGRSGSRSSHRKQTVSAAIATPSTSERGVPIAVTGVATSTSSAASAKNGKPRPCARGQAASTAASVTSSAPPRRSVDVRPRVDAAVGQRDAAQRLQAAGDPVAQLVPVARARAAAARARRPAPRARARATAASSRGRGAQARRERAGRRRPSRRRAPRRAPTAARPGGRRRRPCAPTRRRRAWRAGRSRPCGRRARAGARRGAVRWARVKHARRSTAAGEGRVEVPRRSVRPGVHLAEHSPSDTPPQPTPRPHLLPSRR